MASIVAYGPTDCDPLTRHSKTLRKIVTNVDNADVIDLILRSSTCWLDRRRLAEIVAGVVDPGFFR